MEQKCEDGVRGKIKETGNHKNRERREEQVLYKGKGGCRLEEEKEEMTFLSSVCTHFLIFSFISLYLSISK